MQENDTDKKRTRGTISVKSGSAKVRRNFSGGRAKSVVVEKKRKRVITPGDKGKVGAAKGLGKQTADKGGLSDEEYARRMKALEAARAAEKASEKKEEPAPAPEEEAEAPAPVAADDQPPAEAGEEITASEKAETAPPASEVEMVPEVEVSKDSATAEGPATKTVTRKDAIKAEEVTGKSAGLSDAEVAAMTSLRGPKIIRKADPKVAEENKSQAGKRPAAEAEEQRKPRFTKPDARPESSPPPRRDDDNRGSRSKGNTRRRSGKLTISQALKGDEGGRQRSMAAMRRRQEKVARKQQKQGPAAKVYREVTIPDAITVQELANRMSERSADVIKELMKMGMMVTINQVIDTDTAQLIVEELGHTPVRVSEADVEEGLSGDQDDEKDLKPRAPVVTIMGHVDHGKTSLLDAIRSASVVSGEAGGITQHIGAYQVEKDGNRITFLDTPGHAAFTSMRARGAQVTDIVILVVAADDAVMPQTVEAIQHAKAAEVPMIVAINKIDKPSADAVKVRTDLLQHDVQVEAMGGEVQDVEVSAITGQGLDALLDSINLQAEILEMKANPDRAGEGAVVEAQLDVGRGPVATVLMQRGTLNVGDIFVVGEQWGKVRALINDVGERVDEAGPSVPVEVLGLNGTPEAGDSLIVVESEARAREISDFRQRKSKEKAAAQGSLSGASLDQLLAQAKEEEDVRYLPVLVKSDVQGSAEAISQALEKVGNDEVKVRILLSSVGAITESDVILAEASNAPIIGFNVRANAPARESANQKGVEIRYYSIIYDLVDDVKAAASGLLSPEVRETFIGYAEILEVFRITGVGNVAGCRITEGTARREAGVRLLRDNTVIHEGKLKTLKRFKDEVKDVQSGQECGMAFERYEDMRVGDVIEIFETQEIAREL